MPESYDPLQIAELLPIALEAVARASQTVRDRTPELVRMKSDRNPATDVDYEIEDTVRGFLNQEAPEVAFLGEEQGQSNDGPSGLMWALDPIDGTVNFIHEIPLCAVSLGLVHRDVSVLGVIDLPFLGKCYSTLKGAGAFCGTTRINVRQTPRLQDAVVAVGDYAVGPDAPTRNADRIRVTQRLADRVQRVRMFGSAAIDLAWVAEGRIDGSVMFANKRWDTAAGTLLAREAGALLFDRNGSEHRASSRSTVAVTPRIAGELVDLVRERR